jgi:arginine-tRNA-protein transferase
LSTGAGDGRYAACHLVSQSYVSQAAYRSGTLYYKQDQSRSCCPYYTIRLDAAAFKAKKDQRQANHRWNRYVLGHEYIRKVSLLCPKTRQQKRLERDKFDLKDTVHGSEYSTLNCPTSGKTGKPIEPAHKLVVNLEDDNFTAEKFDVFLRYQSKIHNEDESHWRLYVPTAGPRSWALTISAID